MSQVATTLARLDELERAFEARDAAWAAEADHWRDLEDALATTDPSAMAQRLAATIDAVEQERTDLVAAVVALEAAGTALIADVAAAAEALKAVDYGPATAGWGEVVADLASAGTETAGKLPAGVEALVEAAQETAVDLIARVDEQVTDAVMVFHDALPDAVRSVVSCEAALVESAASAMTTVRAAMTADGEMIKANARNLSVAVLRRQFGHGTQLVQDIVQFRAQMQDAIGKIAGLGGELDRLRRDLDHSIGEATQPIDDIRVILERLLDRFRSID